MLVAGVVALSGCPIEPEPDPYGALVGRWHGVYEDAFSEREATLEVFDEELRPGACLLPEDPGWVCLKANLLVEGRRGLGGQVAWCRSARCGQGLTLIGVRRVEEGREGSIHFSAEDRCSAMIDVTSRSTLIGALDPDGSALQGEVELNGDCSAIWPRTGTGTEPLIGTVTLYPGP